MNVPRLLLALMMTASSAHVGSTAIEPGATSGTLVVTIQGFRSVAGHARVAVFNRDAGFPDDESAAYRRVVTDISYGGVEVRFDDLPLADYAVSMSHDENDAKLNKGLFAVPGALGAVPRRVLRAGRNNFRDNLGDSGVPRNSKPVVYLAFSRGEVAERLKAAVC